MEKVYGMNHRWEAGWSLRGREGILEWGDWEIEDGRSQVITNKL